MKRFFYALLVGLSLFAKEAPAREFITGFEDLPLVSGWTQDESKSLSFDMFKGRIIQAGIVKTDEEAEKDARKFYEKTLPQLGWKKVAGEEGVYMRENEELTIKCIAPNTLSFELITKNRRK